MYKGQDQETDHLRCSVRGANASAAELGLWLAANRAPVGTLEKAGERKYSWQ